MRNRWRCAVLISLLTLPVFAQKLSNDHVVLLWWRAEDGKGIGGMEPVLVEGQTVSARGVSVSYHAVGTEQQQFQAYEYGPELASLTKGDRISLYVRGAMEQELNPDASQRTDPNGLFPVTWKLLTVESAEQTGNLLRIKVKEKVLIGKSKFVNKETRGRKQMVSVEEGARINELKFLARDGMYYDSIEIGPVVRMRSEKKP